MINLDRLIDVLSNFKERPYKLPQTNKFTQKSAYEMKIDELEKMVENNCEQLNDYLDKTMNITSESRKARYYNQDNKNKKDSKNPDSNFYIPSNDASQDSNQIIFNNEEIIDIPDAISCIFNERSGLDKSKYYIYGIKNNESFFNSIVLLTQKDYIIKSKSEKSGAITSFKRELGLKVNTAYSQYDYKQLKFKKSNMVTELMEEGIINYSLIVATSDYIQENICIIDINNKSFLFTPSTVYEDEDKDEDENQTSQPKSCLVILKINEYYIPIMNTNGNHLFNNKIMNIVSQNFEKETIQKEYKERTQYIIKKAVVSDNQESRENVVQPLPLQLNKVTAYKLQELQEMAIKYKINIKKTDNGKIKNKTKAELYSQLT